MSNLSKISVSIVQYQPEWENVPENLNQLSELIRLSKPETDVLVLPEMFQTGFTMNPSCTNADRIDETLNWMKQTAHKLNAVVTGSVLVGDNNNYYNRLYWVQPDGVVRWYNKRHLFHMAGEHNTITAGNERVVVSYNGFRFCLQICYDLRFPVWSRNKSDYDVLIYVANWPEVRINAWNTLLKARAIENSCYVIGSNRVGKDATNLVYNGEAQVVDYLGNVQLKSEPYATGIFTTQLDLDKLNAFRAKFNTQADADVFEIQL